MSSIYILTGFEHDTVVFRMMVDGNLVRMVMAFVGGFSGAP